MPDLLDPPAIHRRRTPNLILHCGAHAVDLEEVASVRTPRGTSTWTPIPHLNLIQQVKQTLADTSLRIGSEAHSLTHDGARYFGLMEVQSRGTMRDDYCMVVGLRNSHDKRFPAGLVVGSSVFVCDNLSFGGEIKLSRKHTRFILHDLPQLVRRAVGLLSEKWHQQDVRINAYRTAEVDDRTAHDLVIRATDVGVCANSYIPAVLREWREPRHREFGERSIWSLFNSFTEGLMDTSAWARSSARAEACADDHLRVVFVTEKGAGNADAAPFL